MNDPLPPRHVAFIMDGNGRWARLNGLRRLRGHEKGAEALRRIARRAAEVKISEISFFALSTENFLRRPRREIDFLMGLLRDYMIREREEIARNNIRMKVIGHVEEFPANVQREIETTVRLSAQNTGMVLRIALNYGSRREILDGMKRILEAVQKGRLDPSALDEDAFRRFLYDPEMPDPDLLIRTAGELRLSNFFLWQASYTEFWVTDVLWPDFDVPHFEEALRAYALRSRKFGAVEPDSASAGAAETRGEGIPAPEGVEPLATSSGKVSSG